MVGYLVKIEPDAILWRELPAKAQIEGWVTLRCLGKHVPYYVEQGWSVLIAEADLRDQAIADTYRVEVVQWEVLRRERL